MFCNIGWHITETVFIFSSLPPPLEYNDARGSMDWQLLSFRHSGKSSHTCYVTVEIITLSNVWFKISQHIQFAYSSIKLQQKYYLKDTGLKNWNSWSIVYTIDMHSMNLLFFFSFIFLLYNIVWVVPYIDMNPPWVYMCSPFWTPLPPPFPSHPSGPSQSTSPEHPVSCIEPGLVIHFTYDKIHISMPFSNIIPPSPSPTESKRLF